jgi:uracil-DNA glycosylase
VLLLNTVLSVEDGQPASHARRGWEALTDALIGAVAAQPRRIAFLLWGAHAQARPR